LKTFFLIKVAVLVTVRLTVNRLRGAGAQNYVSSGTPESTGCSTVEPALDKASSGRRQGGVPMTRRLRRLGGVAATLVIGVSVLIVLLVGGEAGASARANANAEQFAPGTRPTIVLIHGAWADSLSWSGVIQRLQDNGYTVIAAPNPLSGLQQDSETISDLLQTISGPIVVVGHSYGGAVMTDAAYGNTNVKALVAVDAFLPAQGESVFQLTAQKPGSCLTSKPESDIFNAVPVPGQPSGDDDLYVKASVFDRCFANGLSHSEAQIAEAAQRPFLASAGTDVSGPPAWQQIPTWDVVGTIDKIIPPAEQLFMAHRAKAHITEICAGHLSMVSQPAAVTAVIEEAAHATA
jgi:pimeloyl-ACP methyl ester carboxylesterase